MVFFLYFLLQKRKRAWEGRTAKEEKERKNIEEQEKEKKKIGKSKQDVS